MPATSAIPRPDARAAFRACVVAAIRDLNQDRLGS